MPPPVPSDPSDAADAADAAASMPGQVSDVAPSALEWLLFLPQLPASPSSLRVQVWRRTRAAGGLGLQTGVIMFPRTADHERFARELLAEIERDGGSGSIFVGAPLDPALAAKMVARFRDDRDQEYAEFCERCEGLLAELRKESRGGKYTFAELEENEAELAKLVAWLEKIQARDYFGGSRAGDARAALAACQLAMRDFSRAVYAREGVESALDDISDSGPAGAQRRAPAAQESRRTSHRRTRADKDTSAR